MTHHGQPAASMTNSGSGVDGSTAAGLFLPKMEQWMSYQLLTAAGYPYITSATGSHFVPTSNTPGQQQQQQQQANSFLQSFTGPTNPNINVHDMPNMTLNNTNFAPIIGLTNMHNNRSMGNTAGAVDTNM